MFCIKCGAKLHDGARFCANCGAVIGKVGASPTNPFENTPKSEEPKVDTPTAETPEVETTPKAEPERVEPSVNETPAVEPQKKPEKPKKKKGKVGKIIAIVAVIVAAVMILGVVATAACYFLLFRSTLNGELPTYAYVDNDNTGYLCYSNGRFLELGDDISSACLTPDGEKILVAKTNGRVYWTDLKMSDENKITDFSFNSVEDCSVQLSAVTNDFVLITVVDGRTAYVKKTTNYRYSFESEEIVELSVAVDNQRKPYENVVINATLGYSEFVNDVSYVKANKGEISVLRPDSDEFKCIAYYDTTAQISFCGISTDGNTVCWVEGKRGKYSVMLYTDGETESIASGTYVNNVLPVFTMTADPNNEVFVILGVNAAVFLRHGEMESVSFAGTVNTDVEMYTTNGLPLREDEKAAKAFGCYIAAAESKDGSYNVYAISFDGAEKISLVYGAYAWMFAEDKLAYLDSASTLYLAEVDLDEQELSDTIKVAMNVYNVEWSKSSADKIYYVKNYDYDTNTGDLYVYDVDDDDETKIDSNVSSYIRVSEDARYFYYFTNVTKEKLDTLRYGDFNVYDSNHDSNDEIDSDVIVYSAWSALSSGEYDPNSIWYKRYDGAFGSGYKYDICFYNGSRTKTVVDGVVSE